MAGNWIKLRHDLLDAPEAIATQPKESNHTPYGDLLHASTNGDR
jgi:hypothetical protein